MWIYSASLLVSASLVAMESLANILASTYHDFKTKFSMIMFPCKMTSLSTPSVRTRTLAEIVSTNYLLTCYFFGVILRDGKLIP